MTASKRDILGEVLVKKEASFSSTLGLFISGIVSIFGVYGLISPLFGDNVGGLVSTIIALVFLLIIVDNIKRASLVRFVNSILRAKIMQSASSKSGYLVIFGVSMVMVILLDIVGSWTTAEKGANMYTQSKTSDSMEFTLAKADADNYPIALQAWRTSKTEGYASCKESWRGWKSKYLRTCKQEWDATNPQPQQHATALKAFNEVSKAKVGFLDKYLFGAVFTLLLMVTLLMQYLTIAKIIDDFSDRRDELNPENIAFIVDEIGEYEAQQIEHRQELARNSANQANINNAFSRQFALAGQEIDNNRKTNIIQSRGRTAVRISNTSSAKSLPSPESNVVDVETEQPRKERLSWNRQKAKSAKAVEAPIEVETVIALKTAPIIKKETPISAPSGSLTLMEAFEALFKNQQQKGEKLTPKREVIDISKWAEVKTLSGHYATLIRLKVIELVGTNQGYYAKMNYKKAHKIVSKQG